MRGITTFAAAVLAAVFMGTPAAAQMDQPPAFNWTGFYLGASGGGGIGSTRHTNASNGATSGTSNNLDGGIVGATYGFNWLVAPNWLLGVEGDISWAPISDRFTDHGSGFCDHGAFCVTKLHWLGTDRLRAGYRTDDDWLFYATGGVAYGDVRALLIDDCCTDETHMRTGYTLGGGVETPIAPRVSLKLEYLFVDLGSAVNYHTTGGTGEKVSVRENLFRVGLNWAFGAP